MIKKFTTFLASMVALLALSFNASAQTTPVTGFDKDGDIDGLYMLVLDYDATPGATQKVLSLNDDGYLVVADAQTLWQNQVWCLSITSQVNSGNNNVTYKFTNQGLGLPLAVSASDFQGDFNTPADVMAGGNLGDWSFSRYYKNNDFERNQPLYLFYAGDAALYIANDGGNLVLKAVTEGADRDAVMAANGSDYARITLTKVDNKVLTANEFNTVLGLDPAGTKGVSLTFYKDAAGFENPFNKTVIFAEEEVTIDGYLYHYIYKKEGNTKYYLASAKAYTNELSSTLNFNDWQWVSASAFETIKNAGDANDLGRFQFMLTYSPTEDNLYIQIRNVYAYVSGDVTKPENWSVLRNDDATNSVRTNLYVSTEDAGLQVGEALRVITINTLTYVQNTKVKFGTFTCYGETNRTTIPDGVYHIVSSTKSAAGLDQYYASPIFRNGTVFEWVEVDGNAQDPAHMPAYQWVVLQVSEGESYSAVNITNREYPNAVGGVFTNVRFFKTDKDGVVTASSYGFTNVKFVPVTSEALNNPKIGYGYLSEDSLLVSRYLFNYFNQYDMTRYMGLPEKQSVLTAWDAVSSFTLESRKTTVNSEQVPLVVPYGFEVTDANRATLAKRIPGLVQLERTPYTISLKDKGNYTKLNNDTYYGVNSTAGQQYVYFKENNHYDENHYYAFVEVAYNSATQVYDYTSLGSIKAGISDDGLDARVKAEGLGEKRTSSFAVITDDRPLYRRFNTAAESYAANDGRDTLKFVENYRGEALQIEANQNIIGSGDASTAGRIDFLGIWDESRAKSSVGFVVDTAWLERGLGRVKPQYLISIDRRDFAGSDAELCPIDPSPEHQANCHHYRPAVPKFNRGKYLVNFGGLRQELGDHFEGDSYLWKGLYNRAGFVHAIQKGDSLYILLADKYNYYDPHFTNESVNFDELIAADKESDPLKRGVKIVNLQGDRHKFVTWSMRFVDPDNYLTNNDFIIESLPESTTSLSGNYATVPAAQRNQEIGALSEAIAPTTGQWIKSQNGVLVLSYPEESIFDEFTYGDDALIFNVENYTDNGIATDNDKVTTTEVKVIAAEGKVTVLNAAGKKVVVSNILGQTVANTVLSSDNASIAAPKGIVVVAVEGEEPVKAIVK